MVSPNFAKDIEAEVTFLLPKDGGRKGIIFSGFRPVFIYDNQGWDASLWFDGKEFTPRGIPVILFFDFASPEQHLGKLMTGKEFELWDGGLIAKGRVLKLLDLEKSARDALERKRTGS
jgi:hypothetical protein